MFLLAKYNTQTTFTFPMIKRGAVDFAQSADWTPAAADSAISKDNGNFVDTSNTVQAPGGTPTRGATGWKLTLTNTELSCAVAVVQIVDATTKAVEDQCLIIYTYGNASAMIPLDLSINQTGDSYARIGATGSGLTSLASQASVDAVDNFVDTEIADIQSRLPSALVSGKMDSHVNDIASGAITATAIADGAIDDAAVAADMDTYQAKVWLFDDNNGTNDRYVVCWFKNGQPVLASITSPTIQVIKVADGTDLIASTAMTEIASLQMFRYNEGTNRIVNGTAYIVKVQATIDGSTRTWVQPVGRDS